MSKSSPSAEQTVSSITSPKPPLEIAGEHSVDTESFTEAPRLSVQSRAGTSGPHRRSSSLRAWLINVVIPLMLLGSAVLMVVLLGKVEPTRRPALDTTRTGRLKALAPVVVEQLVSLQETGADLSLNVDGTVVPFREAQVAAEVAGRIVMKSSKCESGQFVKKGELLMKIDTTDYELAVQRLSRQQEQEYEAIKELDQEVANSMRLLENAKEDVSLMEKELERQKSLPEGFASAADVDSASRALLSANQQKLTVENQIALLNRRRSRLEASEKLAMVQLFSAEMDLKRTEIRAPIDGVIVREEADLNTFVNRGSTLVVIDDTRKVEVATSLRMDQLYWILDQQRQSPTSNANGYELPETPAVVEYELSGRENARYRWNAKLLSYDGIGLDQQTRTVPVRVVVENPQMTVDQHGELKQNLSAPALVRGMYVQVRLLIRPQSSLVVIPSRAMQPGNRVYQFVPDESVLEITPSETDGQKGGQDAVTESQDDPERATAQQSPSKADPSETPLDSSEEKKDSFEASQWEPGKVITQAKVTPIDSITLSRRLGDSATEDGLEEKMWVCEVSNDQLVPGAWVVVSPIGNLDNGTLKARALKKGAPQGDAGDQSKKQDIAKRDSQERQTSDNEASLSVDPGTEKDATGDDSGESAPVAKIKEVQS